MVMEQEKATKRRLSIDWDKLLGCEDDELTPDLVIQPTITTTKYLEMDSDRQHVAREEYEKLSDGELEDKIRRMKQFYDTWACKLPDKGEKYLRILELSEKEKESRKLRRVEKEATGCENLSQPTSSSIVGTTYAARKKTASSSSDSLPPFTSCFYQKLEENTECNNNVFGQELSILGHCGNRRPRCSSRLSPKVKQKGQTSSRQQLNNLSNKKVSSDAAQNSKSPDQFDFHVSERQPDCFGKKDASEVPHSDTMMPQKGQTIVVVDEEEALAMKIPEHDDKCMKEAKIYYPSRDDPESIEICFEDIKCLDPESYLTSTIMNFYIRYLQQREFSTNKVICDYHFFNTYFYEKLKEAVSNKGKDRDKFFIKFRRWWKGVNIFQKAYVLIPIHEDVHWSLVIICFPHKEDESGTIILHLDSLGLHSSRSIFDNIKSFIKEEWCYLDREVAYSDPPMPYRVWKNISRRIEEKIIEVPQQKNDYDCGLFVLYFIERFIEEAPDRLKRKDLDMFGKRWFKPQEASSLRTRIRCLLKVEFQNVKRRWPSGAVGSSSSDDAPKQ